MGKSKDMITDSPKNNTVAQLYALRAGLSVISERADDIRGLENDIEGEYRQSEHIQAEIDENKKKKNEKIARKESITQEISKIKAEFNKKVDRIVGSKIRPNDPIEEGAYIFMEPGIPFLVGVGIVLVMVFFAALADGWLALLPWFSIGGAVMLVSGIFMIARAKKWNRNRTQAVANVNREISGLEDRIEQIDKQIDDIDLENNKLSKQKKELDVEIEQRVSEMQNNIVSIAQQASLYNSALENEYTRILNPADWQNTDLCIFYLQTGRADSIKECLLLADRQRQNDEIVGTIKAAGDRICSEIRGGFNALGSTMVTCINALSMQIETVSGSLKEVENSNSALLSATQLNNALQAKANATSEALLRDYRYVQNRAGIAI